MNTQCNSKQLHFQGLGSRKVVADFDGGTITSDAGALLLREIDAANHFFDDFASCFVDHREQGYVEHSVKELIAQRTVGLCLGYEDTNDHDELRRDPLLATVCGKLDPTGSKRKHTRDRGNALAGKSTLNRLETYGVGRQENQRYKKIYYSEEAIDQFFVDTFIKTTRKVPKEIILDLDATDDPLHGHQEGRFFHGYYDCYCYLPLYMFCGDNLLLAKLRTANLDPGHESLPDVVRVIQQIRAHWPKVRIILRGDSGFCREDLMRWCEENEVLYIFGIARNSRLLKRIFKELKKARKRYFEQRKPQRIFKDFTYRTLKSWSRRRRVVGKAEYLAKGANPRFVVTNLPREVIEAQSLYEQLYCGRGDMENRIKEQQLYLFADRTSSATMKANQLRLYFSSLAYVLMNELRTQGLQGTELAQAQCHTIRLKLFKIGARVRISVRRIVVSMATGYPYQNTFFQIMKTTFELVKAFRSRTIMPDLVFSNVVFIDNEGKVINTQADTYIIPTLKEVIRGKWFIAGGMACAYSRHIMEHFGPLDKRILYEDYVLSFRALAGRGIIHIPKPLVKYRVYDKSIIGQARSIPHGRMRAAKYSEHSIAQIEDRLRTWRKSGRKNRCDEWTLRRMLNYHKKDALICKASRSIALLYLLWSIFTLRLDFAKTIINRDILRKDVSET